MANVLNYVNYDFDTLVQQLQNRLKNKEAWQDIYRSSTGEMLIELLAYVLNLGMYYTERRAEESYLPTAQLRSSVKNLVALLNYTPKRKTSATGNLTFSITAPSNKIVYIPKYTVCKDAAGLGFLTNEYAAIEKGQTSVSVASIQGELSRLEITSNGSTTQEYKVDNTAIENSADTTNPTLRVIVDGIEWTKVDSFINSLNTDQHYRVINEIDETISIQFGDDINGAAPESGSTIIIQYIESDGLSGNVTFADKVTTLSSTIYDEDGTAVTVTVTNTDSFLGGDAEESTEEIRYEAPRVFKTGNRAVNRRDFISLLENYAGVANANVWGENEEAAEAGVSVVASMLNKVKMAVILQDWALPGTTFKSTLSDYLYDLSMLTVKYEFVTPVILLVIPVLDVKVAEGYSLSQTQADIETALAKKFVLGSTTKLATIVKYSEILAAVHDLEGVAYASLDLEIKKALSDSYDSTYDWSEALDATDIKPETCRVFVDGVYAVTDVNDGDGTGTFSASGISGGIDYSTGVVTLNITPSANAVYVRYQQDKNDNIVPSSNQIAKLEDVDIATISME
jgi:hypothetical protein